MNGVFHDQRPLFAVLDRQGAWGAYLADRLTGHGPVGKPPANEIIIRHMADLEALDSCLIDNQTPVAILLASNFAQRDELAWFIKQHASRTNTLLVIASHDRNEAVEWLLREYGAHHVVRSMADVIAVVRPMRRFFVETKRNHNEKIEGKSGRTAK